MPARQPRRPGPIGSIRPTATLGALLMVAAISYPPSLAAAAGPQRNGRQPATSPDTVAAAVGVSPRGALVRSLVLPGWGQLANGHPYKAAGFAVGAGVLVGMAAQAQSDLDRIGNRLAPLEQTAPGSSALATLRQRQQDLAARRNSRVLLVVAGAVAAGLDAYVDAHLAGFDSQDETLALVPGPSWLGLAVSRRW